MRVTGLQLSPAPQHLVYCEKDADSSELSLCGELKPPPSAQTMGAGQTGGGRRGGGGGGGGALTSSLSLYDAGVS